MSDAEKTTTKDMAKLKLAPLSYKDCIAQIKQVFETCTDEMDSTCKYNRITQIFRKYYEDEDVRDVFEGFLRSLIELDKYASSVADVKNNALAVQSMQVFDDYTSQLDPFDQDIIAESMPENGAIFVGICTSVMLYILNLIKNWNNFYYFLRFSFWLNLKF